MLITFFARSVYSEAETGEASTELTFELNHDPYTKIIMTAPPLRKSWQQIFIPVQAKQDFAANETQICFRAGYGIQSFEIAELKVINYESTVLLSEIPETKVKYDGYDYDETTKWRVEANQRIEQYRKGNLTVSVQNQNGQPVDNAEIYVDMKNHDFMWGTSVGSKYILGSDADSVEYRQRFLENFNTAVMEYEMKWKNFEENPQRAVNMYNWLGTNGLNVRGHALIWDRPAQLPSDIPALTDYPDQLKQRIDMHIGNLAGLFSNRLKQWDVLNEPILNHYMTDIVGTAERAEWFKLAKDADTQAKLYVNETQIVGRPTTTIGKLKNIINEMLDLGAPIEGIGVQGHFNGSACNPADFYDQLDELADTGLDLAVTEYDIYTEDEELQANFIRDIMTVTFSQPKATAFLMWGFWDGYHWKNNAPMFREDWSLKPSGQQYIDLVYNKWWTNESGVTNDDGQFHVKGFYGEYEVSVKVGEETYKTYFLLTPGGSGDLIVTIGDSGVSFSPDSYQTPTFEPLILN